MHVYSQKSTSTTLPRKSCGVSGLLFSHPTLPSKLWICSGGAGTFAARVAAGASSIASVRSTAAVRLMSHTITAVVRHDLCPFHEKAGFVKADVAAFVDVFFVMPQPNLSLASIRTRL